MMFAKVTVVSPSSLSLARGDPGREDQTRFRTRLSMEPWK